MTARGVAAVGLVLAMAGPGASATADADADDRPAMAVRVGWAYGVGGELELRPGVWGVGISGGHVPGYGTGGYVGVQWGQHALGRRGAVAEAGAFRGVHNPLRVADTGLGAYAMLGYALPLGADVSVRTVAGGGMPLTDEEHLGSFEVLAKLTIGIAL